MKIKNVEISAFRIYDDPKNSTFDFTDQKGEIANFVSLYAPNGFGKTSFYDAVEWGVTKSINRFYIRHKELEKLADFQALQNNMPLIKNTKSTKETYVKVTSDTEVYKEIFKKHGRQLHDINFKKPVVHDFQQVILSQEWISAFLTESDGEARYKKFMEKPDLIPINNYYNNLKLQLGVLKDEKDRLNQKISDLKKDIINTDQKDLLVNINKQIDLLTDEFQQKGLFPILLSTTKEEIIKLKDIISNNLISENRESILTNTLETISLAKSGNEFLCGTSLYFEYKSIFNSALKSIESIENQLKEMDDLDQKGNELFELRKNLALFIEQKDKCLEIIGLFEEYKRNDGLLKSKKTEAALLDSQIVSIKALIEANSRKESELKSQFDSTISRLGQLNVQIVKIPELKELIEVTKKEIQLVEELLKKKRIDFLSPQNDIASLNKNIGDIKDSIVNLGNNKFSIESVRQNIQLIDLIKNLQGKAKTLLTKKEDLQTLEERINRQQELNSTIQKFVESGLAIANDRQDSICPLCEHDYKSHIKLAEKISNNTALSSLLKELFLDKSHLITNISSIEEDLIKGKERLIEFYNLDIAETEGKRNAKQKEFDVIKEEIENLDIRLKSLLKKQSENDLITGGESVGEYEQLILKQLDNLNKSKTSQTEELNKVKDALTKQREQVNGLQGQIELNVKETLEIASNINYMKVIEWFNVNLPNSENSQSNLENIKESLVQQIDSLITKQKSLEAVITDKSKLLSSYTKEGLNVELIDLQTKRQDAQQKIEGYNNFMIEKIQINPNQLNQSDLLQSIEKRERFFKELLKKNRQLLKEYAKLELYSENITTFLQSENAKKTLNNLKQELDGLNDSVEPVILDEKNKTKAFLQQKIQEFFYETLINDLYRKIDPHPEFKEVKFQADFESESPRLDVFVKSKGDQTLLIPNLYFSTAQINILSLSIFLATALNSTKYECIFIDDPIQSMDSINVLSTIDLFRSIVVNHNKQIILSTHDENFHNLLQKKMPPELFNSKFLELESFGKLKVNE